jgi:muramidase (phage lysozyme)
MFSEIMKALVEMFHTDPPTPLPIPAPQSPYVNRAKNRAAFLTMIGWSEGTIQIPDSDNGYRALCGGGTFESYAVHPNQPVWIQRIGRYSDGSGRYQILSREWTPYIEQLGLLDFSPPYQDKWAMNSLREVNALDDIDAGRFESAVAKAGHRWASLPLSKFGQTIRTMAEVKDIYSKAGGQFQL